MEDPAKRDANKTKRSSKNEHVKSTFSMYLQKRNYPTFGILENTDGNRQILCSLIENEVSRPNSVLYSCYTSDPVVIDHNFTKFLAWIKELRSKNTGRDIEHLVGPLFCHLYLDILKGGHLERAASFFKAHLPNIDRTKCDDFVRDLMNLFANDGDAECLKEQYRSQKYHLELSPDSLACLKKFITENCHVLFLHILQTWFDIQEHEDLDKDKDASDKECKSVPMEEENEEALNEKLKAFKAVIQDLEEEPQQVFTICIANTKEPINTALIDRKQGVIAYNQGSVVHLRPIHSYDSIFGCDECSEIRLMIHSKVIYTISMYRTILVTGSADGNICIYDLEEMQPIKVGTGHLGPVYATAISSNSTYAASGSHDTMARLWNIENGQCLRIFIGHTQPITSIDFHPNCLYVATGSADKNIRLWSVDNGSLLRLCHGSKGTVYAIRFSPLGDSIASTSDDRKLRVWDVLNAKISTEIKQNSDTTTKLAWSADGKQICTGSIDGDLRIWDLAAVQESQEPRNHEPLTSFTVNGALLGLEHAFDTFACVTTQPMSGVGRP